MTEQIRKALVVDDSRLARIALSKLLQKRNVEVDVAGTGGEALDYLRETRPDVVFMDYMMPDMDGFEATRRIRALPTEHEISVVMYTSQDTDDDREKARRLGIVGFLSKPSGERNLDDVLEKLAQVAAAQAEPEPESEPEPAPAPESDAPHVAAPTEPAPPPRTEPTAPQRAAPRPRPAEPARAPATPTKPDVDIAAEAEKVARKVAEEAITARVEESLAPLREEIGAMRSRVIEEARAAAIEAAEGTGENAVREAAEAVARHTADVIAERVARDTATAVAQQLGPEASQRIMADLRGDVRHYMSELFAADAFRDQLRELVMDACMPEITRAVHRDLAPKLRDSMIETVVGQAEERAVASIETTLEERVVAYWTDLDNRLEARMNHALATVKRRTRNAIVLVVVLAAAGVGGIFFLLQRGLLP